jgi:acetoacetyl-CoA synthetase
MSAAENDQPVTQAVGQSGDDRTTAAPAAFGELLWTPTPQFQQNSPLQRFLDWLPAQGLGPFSGYDSAWQWSVDHPAEFWETLWRYFDVHSATPYDAVLPDAEMPGARWFPGATLNFAEHVFRAADPSRPALIFVEEGAGPVEISWAEVRSQVAGLAAELRAWNVRPGDRVAAYLPNTPHAVVAMLAAAAVGAVWSSCGPDFGVPAVLDRFAQIEPKVFIGVDGYRYGGKVVDRRGETMEIRDSLPSVEHTVWVDYQFPEGPACAESIRWSDAVAGEGRGEGKGEGDADLVFSQVPFDHPLWILYSSGTTGLPKGIVHGHGGILLEHYKAIAFHMGVEPGDRFFWYSSTSWMMWNVVVGSLLLGATAVLYDGSPAFPDVSGLWRLAEQTRATLLGTSAGYLMASQKAEIEPGRAFDLSALRAVGSTGSPLPPTGFRWVYEAVGRDLWLNSLSGGTDVCTAFVAGNPLMPVYSGEIQCRALGCRVESWDASGKPHVGEVGELVLTAPTPSMPVSFWNDPEGTKYNDAYFDVFPGVWHHGDWCTVTERGGVVIHGRSDSTLNKQGVRMGSADIYEVVEKLPEVLESLVIGVELPDGGYWMPLFVHLAPDAELDDALRKRIAAAIRSELTPRHVPDEVIAVPGVPHTRTGKRLEIPVKRLLTGTDPAVAVNLGTVDNPALIQWFVDYSRTR